VTGFVIQLRTPLQSEGRSHTLLLSSMRSPTALRRQPVGINRTGSLTLAAMVVSLLACKDSDRKQIAVSAPTVAHWKLADSATLTIGGKGDSAIVQNAIAARLYPEANELLVVDDGESRTPPFKSGSPTILFFDIRTGQLLRKLGRRGSGPREFQGMSGVAIYGDTIRVLDGRLMRMTSWVRGEDNPTVRVVDPIKLASGQPWYTLPLTGSTVLFRVVFDPPPNFQGQRVDSTDLLLVDSSGGIHRAGRFEMWEYRHYLDAQGQGFSSVAPYRAGTLFKSAADGGFWVAEATQGKLYRISSDGGKRTLIDLPIVREKATDADKSAYSAWLLNTWQTLMGEKGKASALAMLKQMTFSPLLPGFSVGGLASSSDGGVWVAPYARPHAPTQKWYVVSPAGILRATIDVPRDLDVIDAGDDYMVAQRTDPNGGLTVVLYDISH
jgi:hypothetical protein